MRHLYLYEDFSLSELTVFQDPVYANNIFKIRFRQNTDMSNKKGSDAISKPENDLLDRFQVGDAVQGEDRDGKKHVGKIIKISRDENGDGTGITVEERGKTLELVVTTVDFYGDGEVGNREPGRANTSRQLTDIDPTRGAEFYGTSYEAVTYEGRGVGKRHKLEPSPWRTTVRPEDAMKALGFTTVKENDVWGWKHPKYGFVPMREVGDGRFKTTKSVVDDARKLINER